METKIPPPRPRQPPTTGVGTAGKIPFHARVRKDHRIVIPEAERAVLGIREGDTVSVRLRKVAEAPGAPL